MEGRFLLATALLLSFMFVEGSGFKMMLSYLCFYHLLLYRNLVDAANIAALAALMTFRRPDCTVGGENSQEVIIHPLEVSHIKRNL